MEYIGILDKGQEKIAEATMKYFQLKLDDKGWPIFSRGRGCETCQNTGYKGRIGVYEVMRINDEIRELIAGGATTAMIRFSAKQSGMVPLKDYSLRLVGQGFTTAAEVVRVTMSDTGGADRLCPKCRNPIGEDFLRCPFCRHELKKSCTGCGTFQEEHWSSCPKCGVSKNQEVVDTSCHGCQAEIFGPWQSCPYCQTPRSSNAKGKAK